MRCSSAAHNSSTLCGGMFVAMPTAMPAEPLASRLGNAAGKNRWLLLAAVVVGPELDRVLVDAVEQFGSDRGEAGFGVTVGGRVIAVDVAEVALAVDQRVAHGKALREAGERVVDRLVAVRMEVTHRLADDLGALAVAGIRIEPQFAHRKQDAAVHGLQAVAHIRQRAVHDGGQRVREVALFQRILQLHGLDRARARQNWFLAHCRGLAPAGGRLKCEGATSNSLRVA